MEVVFKDLYSFFIIHSKFIIGILVNVLLIYICCKLIDAFCINLEKNLKSKAPDSPLLNLMPILSKTSKSIIVFLLLAGFLQSFGYNVTSLIAGFGITGLAVGFAAKEAIGNVFGSFGLLADKVYKIGEYISFNNYEGVVECINLRSTTIRTLDGFVVNIPNNLLANEEITNISKANQRKIDISVDVEYGTSDEKLDKAIEILNEIASNNSDIKDGYCAFIDNMAPSSIVIRLVAYSSCTGWKDVTLLKSKILREIIHKYRKENINFAFPSTSVYLSNGEG